MAIVIELPSGKTANLVTERVFGRDTMPYLEHAEHVSRQQFKLSPEPQGSVTVTSLSAANPTRVVPAAGGLECAFYLYTGEESALQEGDRVLLLAANPEVYVKVKELPQSTAAGTAAAVPHHAAGPSSAAEGGDEARPSKRAREGGSEADRPAAVDQEQQQQQQQQGHQQQEQQSEQRAAQPPAEAAAGSQAAAAAAAIKPVCLILVGVQGAGKSTFSTQLAERSPLPWVRVNQDSIAGPGGKGTRDMCVEAASAALQQGKNVVIDRMNLDQDQRRPFIRAAQKCGAEAHCLVLQLPVKTCMGRAAGRQDHEGGLQGQAVYMAINQANKRYQEAGPPQQREGLSSVLICESDAEVAAALDAWAQYGPEHPDVAADWERLRPVKKPTRTIMSYFQKSALGAGSGGKPAAGGSAGPSSQQKQEQQPQQQQDAAEPPKPAAGTIQEQPAQLAPAGAGAVALPPQPSETSQQGSPHGRTNGAGNAFKLMMTAAKQKQHEQQGPGAGGSRGATAPVRGGSSTSGGSAHRHSFGGKPQWATALMDIASDPARHKLDNPQTEIDEQCVLILDKFPKARAHALVVARNPSLEGPLSLTAADVPLLEHMQAVAQGWVARQQQADSRLAGTAFKMGFHAVPSLQQLHLHVVSQDFDSPALKNKKHWNSFTQPGFFLELEWVLAQLREHGRLQYDSAAKEALLKADLRCHRCGAPQASMPKLKAHIATCRR